MAEAERSLPIPSRADELVEHEALHVAMSLVTSKGDMLKLAGRTVTTRLRPEGMIVQARPPFTRPWPLRRGDPVNVRLSRSPGRPPLEASGSVAWVRERAYLPSGLAVSLIGVIFDWDPEAVALDVAAFIA